METQQLKEPEEILRVNRDPLREKKQGWKRARRIKEETMVESTTPDTILNEVNKLSDPRDRAFVIILYLCAARVAEVCRYQAIRYGKRKAMILKPGSKPKITNKYPDYKKKNKIGPLKPSMRKRDIEVFKRKGIETVTFKIRNLKNKKTQFKVIPLKLDDERNRRLFKVIQTYIFTLEDDEELFPFKKANGERIVSQLNWNPHSFRTLRLTHLEKYYNFTEQKLMVFAGWSDGRPAKSYIRLNWEDLADSM